MPDSHTVPHDISNRENPHLELDLNSFKINEINYHGKNPKYTIEAKTIHDGSEGPKRKIVDNSTLDENNNIENISNKSHYVPLILPNINENDSIQIKLKFIITTNMDIGPFKEEKTMTLNAANLWSDPNDSEPVDLIEVLNNMNGDGSEENPYEITNDYELQAIKADTYGHFVIENDIDASQTDTWNSGSGFDPINEFEGVLDGNNNQILGLYMNRGRNTCVIEKIKESSIVKNLIITDSYFRTGSIDSNSLDDGHHSSGLCIDNDGNVENITIENIDIHAGRGGGDTGNGSDTGGRGGDASGIAINNNGKIDEINVENSKIRSNRGGRGGGWTSASAGHSGHASGLIINNNKLIKNIVITNTTIIGEDGKDTNSGTAGNGGDSVGIIRKNTDEYSNLEISENDYQPGDGGISNDNTNGSDGEKADKILIEE